VRACSLSAFPASPGPADSRRSIENSDDYVVRYMPTETRAISDDREGKGERGRGTKIFLNGMAGAISSVL